ncbi:MAG: hypothetical protein U5L96_00760 [Owenweeksia sp.]|nr:hypothetical protein [Owenweeksia sp.]
MAVVNAGSQAEIAWYKNGQKVGSSGSANQFTYTSVADGDLIYASLNSDLACAYPKRAFSDTLEVNEFPQLNPTINSPGLMCNTDSGIALIGTPPGGNFVGTGVVNDSFYPARQG